MDANRVEKYKEEDLAQLSVRDRLSDDSTKVFQVKKNEGLNDVEDLVGESSSDSSRSRSSELERRSAFHVEDEAINDVFVGKVGFNTENHSSAESSQHLGECEMMGGDNSAEDRVIEGTLSEVKVEDWVSFSEFEEDFSNTERVFFPELESKRDTNKHYGSLMSLQDKVISKVEKKKRDRAKGRASL
ncbi:hypothetical protein V6N11_021885 [Hibiscus sabdariffa]|uniref:Uncharacterized protein n=1 Tax=Hibiscus sabdariffa TaxID=183260 RepID=A0ABR2THX6_9ROSI